MKDPAFKCTCLWKRDTLSVSIQGRGGQQQRADSAFHAGCAPSPLQKGRPLRVPEGAQVGEVGAQGL